MEQVTSLFLTIHFTAGIGARWWSCCLKSMTTLTTGILMASACSLSAGRKAIHFCRLPFHTLARLRNQIGFVASTPMVCVNKTIT